MSRPPGSQSAVTVISFLVKVPVLSEQMTLVEPSVSTAARRRTMAPRPAMRCMPTASAIVIATGSPSGTMETIWLMATMNTSAKGIPRSRPTESTTLTSAMAATTRYRPKCAMRSSSGVSGSSAAAVSFAILPTSVARPVATTIPLPRPAATCVPE